MKKIALLLILFNTIIFSQSKNKIATFLSDGEVEYTMYVKFERTPKYTAKLNFNKNKASYTYKNFDKEKIIINNYNNIIEITPDTITHKIFLDKKNNKLYTKSVRGYYLYEKIPEMNWTLLKETKMFNKIKCNKAKTNFRGRTYFAWYALSIPNSFGPWKLNGLPGLILEAFDEGQNVSFKMKKIKIPKKEKVNFINPVLKHKKLLIAIKERDERMKNGMKFIESRNSRNDNQLKVTLPEVIELNYFDLN